VRERITRAFLVEEQQVANRILKSKSAAAKQ
jgi:predicted RNA polymerase sigma factor